MDQNKIANRAFVVGCLAVIIFAVTYLKQLPADNTAEIKRNQAVVGIRPQGQAEVFNEALIIKLISIDDGDKVTASFKAQDREVQGIGNAPVGYELIYDRFLIRVQEIRTDIPMVKFFVERRE